MASDDEVRARGQATIIAPAAGFITHQGMAWLEQPAGERRYVQSELRIGRSEQNDLRLNDASVSRYHAFLRRVDGRYLLSDVGSQNGTFVNGRRVHAPSALQSGDRIRLGTTELTFYLETPPESPSRAEESSRTLTSASSGTLQEYVQGEMRIVTVLFLDLHGFTALSEKMSPDEMTQMMNRCFEQLTATVARFGGYVDKYVGDAMMVLFGAPTAHADDPERAVRAALALHDELLRFNQLQRQRGKADVDLQMRIGINTGEVLAGRVGAGAYGQYTVMGDAVNLASRLEHAARVGHVLVGETTHRFTHHVIRYVAMPPTSIRGKAEPVQTYEVVGLLGQTTSIGAALDSTFVGRQRELEQVGKLIKSSSSGFQSATILAPASAGKSALVTELHRRYATDARWAIVRCSEYDRGTPYSTLRQLTLHILRASGRGVDVLLSAPSPTSGGSPLSALAQLLSPNVDRASSGAEAGRPALVSAFTQLLTEQAVRETLVLAVDGVQWIDRESLSVLDAVLPYVEDARVVLITTARPDWLHTWPNEVMTLQLNRFSRQECAQFVSFLLRSHVVEPATLDTLTRESDGNPFLLAEMVRSGVESAGLQQVDGEWRLVRQDASVTGGVDSLRGIIQARLDQLSSDERRVLQVAAVLGPSWTGSLLSRVLEENLPVPDLLRRLAEREFLVQEVGGEEPEYSFTHSITQEVAYASLPQTARQHLHARAGRVLEEQFDPERPNKIVLRELVRHFVRASSHDRAAQYLLHAADAGAGISEDAWAVATYQLAFDHAQKMKDRGRRRSMQLEIQTRMGDALLRQSDLVDAQVAFEAAVELDDLMQHTALLKVKLAHVASLQGDHLHVLALVRAALDGAGIDDSLRAVLEARAALSLSATGHLREADERVARATALTEHMAAGDALELTLEAAATLHLLRGELGHARAVFERAESVRGPSPASDVADQVRMQLALTCYLLGDVETATRLIEETLAVGGAVGDALDQRRGADARDRWSFIRAEILLGRMLVERGLTERGRTYLDDALERGQRISARELVLQARLELARAELAAPTQADVVELVRSLIASAEASRLRGLISEGQVLLSAALLQIGGSAEAADVAREVVVRARTLHLAVHEAVGRRALGLALARTGDLAQARKHLEAASAAFEQMGARLEWTRTSDLLARFQS